MLNPRAIKNLRESLELTQDEFAKKFNVNRVTVARWESGERVPHKKFEAPLLELRQKDSWPAKGFFEEASPALANWCGSAKIREIRERSRTSKRAVLHVAETLIESTDTHPERYLELSSHGDYAVHLLECIWMSGHLKGHQSEKYVEKFLSGYRPQAL